MLEALRHREAAERAEAARDLEATAGCRGSATSIKVHVEHNGRSIDFSVSVSLPDGASGPVPAIIGLGGGSLDRAILEDEGVATMNYNNTAISSETNRSGLFSDIHGDTGASAQVGWA
ncbi:hypothetical protein WMF37_12765 [Sorangium sp. So ce291]|uniref:glucuronyl esterase domain-containing protein n=1 Tax=Sorangium sp. So ce291 TaxID=3133294 RepID=UPI003F6307D5